MFIAINITFLMSDNEYIDAKSSEGSKSDEPTAIVAASVCEWSSDGPSVCCWLSDLCYNIRLIRIKFIEIASNLGRYWSHPKSFWFSHFNYLGQKTLSIPKSLFARKHYIFSRFYGTEIHIISPILYGLLSYKQYITLF